MMAYFNHDDIVLKDIANNLFSDIALKKAQVVHAEGKGKNKYTQLRRFYDELVLWNDKVQFERTPAEREAKYKQIEPFIQMLIAKVAYAEGRGHVDDTFKNLFSHLIKQIDSIQTLRNAKLFFEAFMGFYRVYKGSE